MSTQEKKKSKIVSPSLISRDMSELTEVTGNMYEAVNIIGKRANQLAVEQKEELTEKLEQFASPIDNLEEIFENKEQIEISKYYERLPKNTTVATEKFLEGEIYHRYKDAEEA